jgi:O-antigen/teichoic acid export membrane protein
MKFASASAIYVVANAVSAGVPFLLLPLLTRVLSPAEYGQVVAFFLLVTTCGTFAGLSVHAALGVAWFKHERTDLPRLVGAALGLGAISTVLVAAAVVALLQTAPGASLGVAALWGAAAAVTAGCNVLLQCQLVLWQSQQRPVPMATLQICASLLNMGLSLAFVLLLGWGGEGRNAGVVLAAITMALCAVALLFGTKQAALGLRWSDVRSLLAFGLPLVPHAVAGVLLATADRYMVSSQLGAQALGIYGAAAQLGAVMVILGDAFVKAFNPWLYARFASSRKDDALSAVGAMYASIPAFLVLASVVGAALWLASSLLLGPAYRAALAVLPWFLLGGAFNGMYLAVSGLYFFSGRTGLLSSVTLPVAVLGALLTAGSSLRWGLEGAALGYALTQGLLALGAWAVASRVFPLPWSQPVIALAEWWPFARRASP